MVVNIKGNRKTFESLMYGEIFFWEDSFFIKIEKPATAVNINNGSQITLKGVTEVTIPSKSELQIEW